MTKEIENLLQLAGKLKIIRQDPALVLVSFHEAETPLRQQATTLKLTAFNQRRTGEKTENPIRNTQPGVRWTRRKQ